MSQWQGQIPSFPQFQNQSCGCQTFNGSMQTVPLYQAGKGSGCSVNPQVDFQGGCEEGCTPQVYQMNQLLNLSQGLSSAQLLTLVQGLQERIRTQGRDMPEVFGQRPVEGFGGKGSGSGVPPLDFGLDVGTEGRSVDVFSKSEKWLGTPPVPNVSSWSSRDAEVIGWSQYSRPPPHTMCPTAFLAPTLTAKTCFICTQPQNAFFLAQLALQGNRANGKKSLPGRVPGPKKGTKMVPNSGSFQEEFFLLSGQKKSQKLYRALP